MTPDRVLVICLLHPGRREAFDARWRAAAGGHPYSVLAAVDEPDDPAGGRWLSHVAALEDAAAGGGVVLILEDSACFAPGFSLDLPEPPPDWRLLRLGGRLHAASGPARGGWQPVRRISHTPAYLTRRPGSLRDRVLATRPHEVSRALSGGLPGHYRLTPATVGHAADRHRPADTYWETGEQP